MFAATEMDSSNRVYAPFIELRTGENTLMTTISLYEYAAFVNNINRAYSRWDPNATIRVSPREVEGVESLREIIEIVKKEFKLEREMLDDIPEDEWPPDTSQLLQIGDVTIDGAKYMPYSITAYGYELVIQSFNTVDDGDMRALQDVCDAAFNNINSFILLDITVKQKIGSDVMQPVWIESVVPSILSPTQRLHNGFVYDTLDDVEIECDIEQDFVQQVVDNKRSNFIRALQQLYQRGTIALDPSSLFIEYWELAVDNYAGLYHPTWRNTLVTSDPTTYLLLAHDVYSDKKPLDTMDRNYLSQITIRDAAQYVASPQLNTTYRSAMRKTYEFYSGKIIK